MTGTTDEDPGEVALVQAVTSAWLSHKLPEDSLAWDRIGTGSLPTHTRAAVRIFARSPPHQTAAVVSAKADRSGPFSQPSCRIPKFQRRVGPPAPHAQTLTAQES